MVEFIDNLCVVARAHHASDLFLHEGRPPQIRLEGKMMDLGDESVPPELMESFWRSCGATETTLDLDTAYSASDGGRFRVNLFRYLGQRGAVLREIKMVIPELESLHLPVELLTSWVARPSGLVVVAGRTGSGKSTTLASSLQWLNRHIARHVVTIEDPIEYLFQSEACLFSQREVGLDTPTFAEGLRRSLRQSPDVIFLGEIRDHESAATALQAAETGHLVLTTLHSSSVPETIERFIQLFPASDRDGAQRILSTLLLGVLCQQLIPSQDGTLIPILEFLQNEGLSRKHIQEGRTMEIADLISRGEGGTSQSFLAALARMVQSGVVSQDTALEYCENPHELSRILRGISSGSSTKPRTS